MVGPAVGAVLYSAGRAWPFLTQAVCVALGALLIARMRLPVVPRTGERTNVRRDIAEGLRWTWDHAAMRTLTLTIVTFNVTFGAAMSVLVLYADQRLHAGDVGFGLLSTFTAIGGIAGMAMYDRLERRFSLGNIMRGGLIIETLTHVALALTTVPAVAYAIMFVFGAHAFVWGTTSRTVRMRSVPLELQGRVSSLYMIGVFGGLIIGQGIGGVVARIWGVTGPFWFGFGGSAIILALIWRELALIAHDAEADAGADAGADAEAGAGPAAKPAGKEL
jgi:predicted MFS family arabinose efflux permease